jgi:cell wall-associated NlpC family hydrolase
LAVVILYPVSLGLTRAAGVALTALLAVGLLGLWWHTRFLRWTLLGLYGAVALFGVFPGREAYDRPALRQEIAQALQRYEGVRYVWGGENWLGIDCSGLVRRGAIEGTFSYGLRTCNPLLVRTASDLWWHDGSAQQMAAGMGGLARKVTEGKSLSSLNDKNLHPGDFSITRDGVHALAYAGDHLWMEADPGTLKVMRLRLGKDRSPWFETPVVIMRWRYLEMPKR